MIRINSMFESRGQSVGNFLDVGLEASLFYVLKKDVFMYLGSGGSSLMSTGCL